jgi:hypothetical protein
MNKLTLCILFIFWFFNSIFYNGQQTFLVVKMSKCVIIILFFVLQSQAERLRREEDTFEFEVCPESHPYAFSRGHKCCSKPNLEEPDFWRSNACRADSIACPEPCCEDLKDECKGYGKVAGESKYSGFYTKIEYSEANRPIYRKEEADSCIWWHKPYRHWWIGGCEQVGTNSGYAYMLEDTSCPDPSNPTWRVRGSDEMENALLSADAVLAFKDEAGSGQPSFFTGTAALNVIVREGKFKQTCKFVFRNGQFRCEKL